MSVIEAANVTFSYDKKKIILEDISVRMETGKMYAILGPSGTGKTTLLALLGGLDLPVTGKILFNGEDIRDKGLEYHRRNDVAIVFQNYNLIDYMNAIENVKLMAKKDALPIIQRLGLTLNEATRNVLNLSGGQQQRVAIARALASDAPVILADEPTGNLDEDTATEIASVLKESAHEFQKCVIVVTHNDEIAKQADVVFKMKYGKVLLLDKHSSN